jgi:hypothetical protein
MAQIITEFLVNLSLFETADSVITAPGTEWE